MTDILFTANGASATVLVSGELTSGMVGVPVRFAFDSDWDGLNIVAVFDGGGQRISVPLLTDMEAVLPWEVIAKANTRLHIGAEGRKSDGSIVIPTVWANAGYIREGAAATDDEGNPPTPSIYDQIMAAIEAGQLQGNPGEDGVSPTVSVTEIEGGHRVTITDENGKQAFDVMNGKDGNDASVSIVDNLGSSDPNAALSARMGGVLKTKIEDDVSALDAQLQRQINQRVKTVNGVAPDENGNVNVEGGGGGIAKETDPTVPEWAKNATKPSYSKSEVGLGNVDNVKQYSANNPPPYPVTSVNGKTGAVSLDAAAVGARPSNWMPSASEVGALPASTTIPTKVSQLANDKGYLTEHQDISGKLDASALPTAIDTALAQAKASGEFDGKDGSDGFATITETELAALTQENLAAKYADGVRVLAVSADENLVPASISQNGVVYNGCGYMNNYRLNSSGGTQEALSAVLTGFMPYTYGKIIEIAGGCNPANAGGQYIATYDSNFALIGVNYLSTLIGNSGGGSVCTENNEFIHTVKTSSFGASSNANLFKTAAYIRVCLCPCVGSRLRVRYI